MSRQPNRSPTWATNSATYTAPGEAWNGAARVQDPGASQQADGYAPENRPPATWENWIRNLYGKWFGWLDRIQIHNWVPASELASASGRGMCWSPMSEVAGTWFHVGGAAHKVYISFDGTTWTEDLDLDTLTCTTESLAVAASSQEDRVSVVGAGNETYRRNAGSWSRDGTSLAAGFDLYAVVHDEENSLFCAVGAQGTGTARAATSSNGLAYTERIFGDGSDTTSRDAKLLAVANSASSQAGRMVALCSDTNLNYWYSDNGGVAWTKTTGTWTGNTPRALHWDPETDYFYLAIWTGAATQIWRSRDGTAFVQIASVAEEIQQNCLAMNGRWIVIGCVGGHFAMTQDLSNWEYRSVPAPAAETPLNPTFLGYGGGRFLFCATDVGDTSSHVSMSLCVGNEGTPV